MSNDDDLVGGNKFLSLIASVGLKRAKAVLPTQTSGIRDNLDVLIAEYRGRIESEDKQFDNLFRVIGFGFATAVALMSVASSPLHLPEVVFWIAPFVFVMLYTLAIQSLAHIVFASYYIRELEDEIRKRTGLNIIQFEQARISGMTSAKTGDRSIKLVYLLSLIVAGGLYVAIIGFCFWQIPGPRSFGFLALHIGVGMILLISQSGLWLGLRSVYERAMGRQTESSHNWFREQWYYAFLPKPLDLVAKSFFSFFPALVVLWVYRAPITHRLLWLALLSFLTVDFLAKQATYIWNHIYDYEDDKVDEYKRQQNPLTRWPEEIKPHAFAKVAFIVRVVLAVLLAGILWFAFGLWWLLLFVVVIFVWQHFYQTWAKRDPVRRLSVCALGYFERSSLGAILVMWVTGHWDWGLFFLLGIYAATASFATLSAYWRSEYIYGLSQRAESPSKAKKWYINYGSTVGCWATILLLWEGIVPLYIYSSNGFGHSRGILIMTLIIDSIAIYWVYQKLRMDNRSPWHLLTPTPAIVAVIGMLLWLGTSPLSLLLTLSALLPLSAAVTLLLWLGTSPLSLLILSTFLPLSVAVMFAHARFEELDARLIKRRLHCDFQNLRSSVDRVLFVKKSDRV